MGGKASRDKGQRGEREVSAIIHALTGWEVKRKVRNHAGDSDLDGVPDWAIEVKNCATLAIPAWWRQAVEQAGSDYIPVLFYKLPRKGWRALWPISAIVNHDETFWYDLAFTCDTSIDAWATVAREIVEIQAGYALDDQAEELQAGEAVH